MQVKSINMKITRKKPLYRSFKSLFRPFDSTIWLIMCAFLVVTSFFFYILARIEHAICQSSVYWTRIENSAWYTYGTFMGESITGTINSEQAWAIRYTERDRGYVINFKVFFPRLIGAIWLWYSFIMTAAYGGALRAVLLNPGRKETVDTVKDIVDLSSTWRAVDYGDGFWSDMLRLGIDGMQEFHDGLERVKYKDFPLYHVSAKIVHVSMIYDIYF